MISEMHYDKNDSIFKLRTKIFSSLSKSPFHLIQLVLCMHAARHEVKITQVGFQVPWKLRAN